MDIILTEMCQTLNIILLSIEFDLNLVYHVVGFLLDPIQLSITIYYKEGASI